mgnify:CR=1 FL=1
MSPTWTTVTITRTIEIECRVAHVPGVRETFHDPGEPEEFWVETDDGQPGHGDDGNGQNKIFNQTAKEAGQCGIQLFDLVNAAA